MNRLGGRLEMGGRAGKSGRGAALSSGGRGGRGTNDMRSRVTKYLSQQDRDDDDAPPAYFQVCVQKW